MAITKVSSGVISANAVTATIVAENVITSSEIATDGVGTLQIANDAVTSAKLDTNIDIAGTLDVTGVLTADSNVVIAGNLTVNGTTVTNSATNTTIEDALIELGTGTTGTPANDAGIIIERGDSNNAFMGFDESADKFIVATTTATGASTGDLTLTAAPLVTGALTASGLSYPTSDGSANQVIKTDGSGNLSFVTAITDGAVVHNYTATGDGSTTTFDTGINPQDEVNTWVHIDGVYQNKSEYSYNGTSITFSTAPDSGAAIDVITGNQNGFSTADSVLGVYSTTTTDTATYDTGLSASTENNVNIFIEGVYQPKSTYTWSGSTITFDANTPTGLALEVIASKTLTSGAVVTGSITDSAVTTAKIADNAITSAKIVNNSITGADISATTDIVANTFTGALTGNVTGNVTGNLTGTIQTAAQTNITSLGTLTGFTSTGIDDNATSTAITIDSSENLLVGKTSSAFGTAGVQASASNGLWSTRSGLPPLALNRLSTNGDIVDFYKDSAAVGHIGVVSSDRMYFATADGLGLQFDKDNNRIVPCDAAGAYNNNVELGDSSLEFTNLWLSNNAYIGNVVGIGTTSPGNTLDVQNSGDNIIQTTGVVSGGVTALKLRQSRGSLSSPTNSSTNGDGNYIVSQIYRDAGYNSNAWIGLTTDSATDDGRIVFGTASSGTVEEKMRIDSSGYVEMAGASQVRLTLGNSGTAGTNTANWVRGTGNELGFNSAGGGFHWEIGGTERMRVLSSGGLTFNGDTAGANALDDYEEGTWTVTDGSGASLSFTVVNNKYTKVGRLVVASAQVQWPSTSSAAYAQLNLPFTAVSSASEHGGVVTEQNYDTNNVVTASINSTAAVWFRVNGGTALTNAHLSGKKLRFSVIYHAA